MIASYKTRVLSELLSKEHNYQGIRMREFQARPLVVIYYPLSRVESNITRREVWLMYPGGVMNELKVVK